MNLSQLADLGEFIGGIAVLATLLYLAMQVRHNTRAVEASSHSALLEYTGAIERMVVADPEVADLVYRAARDPEGVSEPEWERFVSFGLLRFTAWEAAFLHSRKGIIDEEMWIAWDGGSRILVAGPGFARFWNEAASAFAPSFRRYIEVEVFRETKSG